MKRRVQVGGWDGFTIVETLIVLAISGVMLSSIIALISGKQDRTQFQAAINEASSQLQQVNREVAIGYYPDINNVRCTATGSLSFTTLASNQQGTNQGCVFLGKVVQYGISDGKGSEYAGIYILAGCQYADCIGSTPADKSNDKPVVIDKSSANTFPSVTSFDQLENGLSTAWVHYYTDAAPTNPVETREFAVLQSQATYGGSCSGVCSGSQQFNLYGITDPPPYSARVKGSLTASVDRFDQPANYVQADKVEVCLKSGTTDQSGLLTITGDGSAVATTIFDGGTCS